MNFTFKLFKIKKNLQVFFIIVDIWINNWDFHFFFNFSIDLFTNYTLSLTYISFELQSSIVFKWDILQFDNSNVEKDNILLIIF